MEAHLLTLNNFNKPLVYDSNNAAYVHIVYLLLLEPGKIVNHPKAGVGLRSKYRHNNDADFLSELATNIENQINTYLPSLATVEVSLTVQDHLLGIIIDTTTGTYAIAYDSDEDTLDTGASYVLDDLSI